MGNATRLKAGGTQVRGGGPGPWLVAACCPPRRLDCELADWRDPRLAPRPGGQAARAERELLPSAAQHGVE